MEPLIGRADVAETLHQLLTAQIEASQRDTTAALLPGHVHVWGAASCGKSLVLRRALRFLHQERAVAHCAVDCVQACRRAGHFFDAALCAVADALGQTDDCAPPAGDCGVQFVARLNGLLRGAGGEGDKPPTVVLVADMVERLAPAAAYALALLPHLPQLTAGRLCVVAVSRLPWLHLARCVDAAGCEPLAQLQLEPYDKEQLKAIVFDTMRRRHGDGEAAALRTFCDILVDVCLVQTTDLRQLLVLARTSWPQVAAAAADDGDAPPALCGGKRHVWAQCRPVFERALGRLHWAHMDDSGGEGAEEAAGDAGRLPSVGRLLLAAAYIASYNPKATDRRFFALIEQKGRRVNRTARAGPAEHEKQHVRGPQAFDAARWQRIFYALAAQSSLALSAGLVRSMNIQPQMATLAHSGLVAAASAAANLSQPKFRCVAALDTVEPMAKSLEINIKQYLIDFND